MGATCVYSTAGCLMHKCCALPVSVVAVVHKRLVEKHCIVSYNSCVPLSYAVMCVVYIFQSFLMYAVHRTLSFWHELNAFKETS